MAGVCLQAGRKYKAKNSLQACKAIWQYVFHPMHALLGLPFPRDKNQEGHTASGQHAWFHTAHPLTSMCLCMHAIWLNMV
eukprot:1145413-Pelagomonas_calceolata.AAC.11